jgi:DNA-binding beta-propeller fold protein YncE
MDAAGNLFVADAANNTIRKIVVATEKVTTLAGQAQSRGSEDGVGQSARFYNPQGLAYDGAGHLFVADMGNHAIRKVDVATGTVTTVLGVPGQAGVVLAPSPARLNAPTGLAFGARGELYIADQVENAVLVTELR